MRCSYKVERRSILMVTALISVLTVMLSDHATVQAEGSGGNPPADDDSTFNPPDAGSPDSTRTSRSNVGSVVAPEWYTVLMSWLI